jgi:phosphatidylserine/phosphatidylglycerophosphate/cardiolipin synthase-like enzyme
MLDHTGKFPVSFSTDERLVNNVANLEAGDPGFEFRPAQCRFLQNRPRFDESYILQAYLQLITGASEELLIANAYFIPTPVIKAALMDAARRCVAVTLVTNSPDTNDLPEISLVGRGYYQELLSVNESPEVRNCENPGAGLRIWEWIGTRPGDPNPQGTMHSKFAVADRRVSLVGSYNLDPRSERLNSETALVFDNDRLSRSLAEVIVESDLSYAVEVTPEAAAGYVVPEDAMEHFRKSLGDAFVDEL